MSRTVCFAIAVFLSFPCSAAWAGGFAILEQSSEGTGTAYAGAAAGYGDGSEVAFNPAAMAWLDKTVVSHSSHLVIPSAEFKNQGSKNSLLGGIPLSGSDGPDGGGVSYIPNFYGVYQISESVSAGLGINTPFGLKSEYDSEWVGRYHGIDSELVTIDLQPAISVKITPDLSFGVGLDIMYADASLSNAIDFGTIGVARLGAAQAAALGLRPQSNDGIIDLEGDDWSTGVHLGSSYRYDDLGSRIGLAWHSKIPIDIDADADFQVPDAAQPLTATGLFTDSGAGAGVTLPTSISLGAIHRVTPAWTVFAESQWTEWTSFEELRVEFDSIQPDSAVEQGWDNTWRWSVGAKYDATDALSLRTGFTFDQTPISDSRHRTPRIPDNDRRWIAFGIDYEITDSLKANASYAHLFLSDGGVDITDSLGNNLAGEFDLSVDIVSLGLTYEFS